MRRVADRRADCAVYAGGDEALESLAFPVDDPECGVAGAGQSGGGLDQPLQQLVEGAR